MPTSPDVQCYPYPQIIVSETDAARAELREEFQTSLWLASASLTEFHDRCWHAGFEPTDPLDTVESAGGYHCRSCQEWYNPDRVASSRVTVRRDEQADGRRPVGTVQQDWCEACATSATYCSDDDSLWSQDAAQYYLFLHSNDEWHTDPEESESESEDDYDEDSDGSCLYAYNKNVVDLHGWPTETAEDSLCMGVELESEPKRGFSQGELVDALGGKRGNGRYMLKSDGSLTYGAELVTLPYTLEYHQQSFGWSSILDSDVHRVGRSGAGTTNCGIHIHVNRRAVSPLTIGKALVFLNSADNAGFVNAIAQRTSNGYASRDTQKKITDIHCGNRYDLLNVSGMATIEFRLFRGNLRPERVLKNLEFCHALLTFCRLNGIKASARVPKFLEFVATSGASYPHLLAFIIQIGLMPRTVTARLHLMLESADSSAVETAAPILDL